jgi:hypothetical protein
MSADKLPRLHTEVKWEAVPVEAPEDKNQIVALKLTRTEAIYPVKSNGDIRWSDGTKTSSDPFTVPVAELADVLHELVNWTAYYATGAAARDAR